MQMDGHYTVVSAINGTSWRGLGLTPSITVTHKAAGWQPSQGKQSRDLPFKPVTDAYYITVTPNHTVKHVTHNLQVISHVISHLNQSPMHIITVAHNVAGWLSLQGNSFT